MKTKSLKPRLAVPVKRDNVAAVAAASSTGEISSMSMVPYYLPISSEGFSF